MKKAGKIKGCRPATSQILVELLNAEEALGTTLLLGDNAKQVGAPQGYVVGVGPSLPTELSIKMGDRVLLQGTFIPVPNWDNYERERGIVELHNIKGILEE